ncbi:hypothetical protein NL676_028566 [Syzygium grande]|nr:hypothetical protein NL676_028566 [Syzygium grande]
MGSPMTSRTRWWGQDLLLVPSQWMAGTHSFRSVVAVETREAAGDPRGSRSAAKGKSGGLGGCRRAERD